MDNYNNKRSQKPAFGNPASFKKTFKRNDNFKSRSSVEQPSSARKEGSFNDRPQRSFGDRPQGSLNDRPQRSFGDRPQGSLNDRPQRSFGDRPQGSINDRPQRSFGGKPQGSFNERPQKSFGEKPHRDFAENSVEKREGELLPLPAELFISCQPSLEELLYEELIEMGVEVIKVGYAGVSVENSMENIYKINYCSRLAGKVLLPIAAFTFSHSALFVEQANIIDWSPWLNLETTFVIKVNGQSTLFNNTLYAAQLLKDGICDQFRTKTGERPSVSLKDPDIILHLFLEESKATVYYDTSKEALFKRGWRQEAVPAPLQETMACAVLRLSGYKGEGLLVDPCCGGGTILIEAAMIATKTPAGFYRDAWGFTALPDHDEKLWQEVKQNADSQIVPLREGSIIGIDIQKDALRICKVNIISAGFQEKIVLLQSDFKEAALPERFDLLIVNPPHGERLGDEEQWVPLYRDIGDFIKHKGQHKAKAFVYTSSLALSKEIGLKADKRHVITSSAQECRVIEISVTHSSKEPEVVPPSSSSWPGTP